MRTVAEIKCFKQHHDSPCGGIHESVFRSYQILERVKEMLQRGDSTKTIQEIICECEGGDSEQEEYERLREVLNKSGGQLQ